MCRHVGPRGRSTKSVYAHTVYVDKSISKDHVLQVVSIMSWKRRGYASNAIRVVS